MARARTGKAGRAALKKTWRLALCGTLARGPLACYPLACGTLAWGLDFGNALNEKRQLNEVYSHYVAKPVVAS